MNGSVRQILTKNRRLPVMVNLSVDRRVFASRDDVDREMEFTNAWHHTSHSRFTQKSHSRQPNGTGDAECRDSAEEKQ